MKGLREFLLRGNVVDLAVGVVIGAAFGAVVTALVKDLLTPLIAAIVGTPDFSAISFTINNSKFLIGDFLNAVISFLLIGTAVYYFVVLPVNALMARARRGEAHLARPHAALGAPYHPAPLHRNRWRGPCRLRLGQWRETRREGHTFGPAGAEGRRQVHDRRRLQGRRGLVSAAGGSGL